MPRLRMSGASVALMQLVSIFMAGCPIPGDVGVKLLVSPEILNFGLRLNALSLQVSKNASSTPSGPIVVESKAPWIMVEACTTAAENCSSRGPLDSLTIPVRIDRSLTKLGTNRGFITVAASGASLETVTVYVEDMLEADFSVNQRSVEVGQPLVFTDRSASSSEGSPILGRRWDFDDGTTSTATNPVHIFRETGIFSVSLTVITADSEETVTKESYITVTGTSPAVDFEANPRMLLAGQAVAFTDLSSSAFAPIIGWLWDFGDGGSSTEQNPVHVYENPGAFTVTLTAETQFGAGSETKESYILVRSNVPAQAEFTLNPLDPVVGQPVRFTDLSNPGASTITRWEWDFGDGSESTEQNPLHTYTATDSYEVTLTITTEAGTFSKTRVVNVENRPPDADFTVNKVSPSTFEVVQFRDLSDAGSSRIVSWRWTFGDGSESALQNPTHAYRVAGVYTVSLTVVTEADANNTSVERKQNYITVLNPPSVEFTINPLSAFTGDTIAFTNQTTAGSESNLTYAWDFGDPASGAANTSAATNATHVYNTPGTYTIILTATTPTRSVSRSHSLTVDVAPTPDFSATPRTVITRETVQFTDLTTNTAKRPVEGRTWTFGDGQQSNQINPTHSYVTPGVYDISLSVNYTHSVTGAAFTKTATKTGYITVNAPQAPTANFEADTECALTGFAVNFTDLSQPGSRPITDYQWTFGDGGTSTERNPSHTYTAAGTYTVSLTVTSSALPAGSNQDRFEQTISVNESTALDEYVRAPDPSYSFTLVDSFSMGLGGVASSTAYILRMTSQQWRTSEEVYEGLTWTHNLGIVVPDNVNSDSAMLLVDGGDRFDTDPDDDVMNIINTFAIVAGSVTAVIDNVPSQPIGFADEAGIRDREEDEIIAYSYDKFLQTFEAGSPDNEWPVLPAMAKAVVRAMDTIQEFLRNDSPVEDFVVTGASKRGWTTWLTAAADCRVRAIMPLVIDVLNMDEQMRHHRNAYGYWSPEIYDYSQMKVLDRLFLPGGGVPPEAQALLDIVDPFEYRDRLTMPKYIINGTGDQFFLPDSSQFYIGDLPQEFHLDYIPNTDHGLSLDEQTGVTGEQNVLGHMLGWYMAVIQDVPRPSISWTYGPNNTIVVTPSQTPSLVRMWQASNPEGRDFRLQEIGAAWTATTLAAQPDGTFIGQVPTPAAGWRAFYVQVVFANAAQLQVSLPGIQTPPFTFSTGVRVVPDVYPNFEGVRDDSSGIPVLTVQGDAFTMGFDYGTLMAEEINTFIPAYLAAAMVDNPTQVNPASLDLAWAQLSPKMDPRVVEEINGIANGAILSVQTLQRAHMVPVVETGVNRASSLAVWDGTTSSNRVLTGYALNAPMDRGAQNYPVVVIYVPEQGFPHANVTFAGFAFGHVGINLGGVSTMEIDDGDSSNNFAGTRQHFMPFFRETLYEAASLRQALELIEVIPPTRSHHFVIGDGRFERRGAKALVAPNAAPQFIFEDDANDEFFRTLPGLVYAGQFADSILFPYVETHEGEMNDEAIDSQGSLQALTQSLGDADNILNVVFDNRDLQLHVNFANGDSEAFEQEFVTIEMQSRIPPGPPVGR